MSFPRLRSLLVIGVAIALFEAAPDALRVKALETGRALFSSAAVRGRLPVPDEPVSPQANPGHTTAPNSQGHGLILVSEITVTGSLPEPDGRYQAAVVAALAQELACVSRWSALEQLDQSATREVQAVLVHPHLWSPDDSGSPSITLDLTVPDRAEWIDSASRYRGTGRLHFVDSAQLERLHLVETLDEVAASTLTGFATCDTDRAPVGREQAGH